MRDDVKAFVELFARILDPPAPVVEIGALQTPGQEGYADLRPAFSGKAYVGCDLVPGPGVDRVEDVHALGFADGSVGTIVAADSLEHVADPRRAVAELARVLRPGGVLAVVTPFAFPIHHPPDYSRFTPEGLATLLAPFPAAAVWGAGDAQWPHTVYAVAAKTATAEAAAVFAAAARHLAEACEADGRHDPLVPFVPLANVARHDSGDVRPEAVGPGPGLTQEFACGLPDLCRIDVKLAAGGGAARSVVLSLADSSEPARVLASATARVPATATPRWVALQFGPLTGSAGRRFAFRLTSPDGAPDGALQAQVSRTGTLCFTAFARRRADGALPSAAAPAPVAASAFNDLVHAMLLVPRLDDVLQACRDAVAAEATVQRRRHVETDQRLERLAEQLLRVELRLEALQRGAAGPGVRGRLARLLSRYRASRQRT